MRSTARELRDAERGGQSFGLLPHDVADADGDGKPDLVYVKTSNTAGTGRDPRRYRP